MYRLSSGPANLPGGYAIGDPNYTPTPTPSGQTMMPGVNQGGQQNSLEAIVNQLLQGGAAQTGLQVWDLATQENVQNAIYGQQAGELGQQYGFQQQGFGLQQAGLGLQGQSLDQQLANLQSMYGLQQQQFGVQQASQASQNQLAAQQFQNQMASYGIQNQGIGAERNQVAWNTNQQGMANQQSSAASGSFGGKGYYNRAQNLWEQAMYQYGGLDRQQQQLFLQMVGSQEAFKNTQTQEFLQGRSLSIEEQRAAQQNTYSQQQIADSRQKLYLDYKSLGLTEQQAQAGYQNALNKLGLQNTMTVDQLETEIAKAKAGMYTPVSQYLGQLMAAGAPITG